MVSDAAQERTALLLFRLSDGRPMAVPLSRVARLEVFDQSGHFPHLTEPRRLAQLLAAFVQDTEAAQLDPTTLTERLRSAV